MKKKTILIFGASSFMGSNLLDILKKDFRVIGTYFKTPVKVPGVTTIPCNVLKKDLVATVVSRLRPDYIIYAVGVSSIFQAQKNPKMADDLNSTGAMNCASISDRYGAKFVYFSSGFVFKSQERKYSESEIPLPDSIYGKTVLSMEFYLQRSCMNYLVLRCSPIFGHSFNPCKPTWYDKLEEKFLKNESFEIDDSIVTGFIDIKTVANTLKLILIESTSNPSITNRIFQLSSHDFMTRYEFSKLYAKIFKKDLNIINRFSQLMKFQENEGENMKNGSGKTAVVQKNIEHEVRRSHFVLETSNIEDFLAKKTPSIEECVKNISKIN